MYFGGVQQFESRHIGTGYGLDDRGVGVWVLVGTRIFSTSLRPVLRPTQLPSQWVPRALSLVIKPPGRQGQENVELYIHIHIHQLIAETCINSPHPEIRRNKAKNKNSMAWVRRHELYRPSDRRLSAKLVPTLADRGCRVVSATNPLQSLISVF
jgi:hypothetical protein